MAIREVAQAMAAQRGHEPIVDFFCREDMLHQIEDSPMMSMAAEAGHAPVVQLLLAQRAGLGATSRSRPPLREASGHGHVAVLELLLRARADVRETDESGSCAMHEA